MCPAGNQGYKAHKYSLDSARSYLDYNEVEDKTFVWIKRGETDPPSTYKSLEKLARLLSSRDEQVLTYFLDGSRHVYKVDDMAYSQSGNRSVIYPIIAGQVGVGVCKRMDKKMSPEALTKEILLSLPSIANPNGKDGFFEALSVKCKSTISRHIKNVYEEGELEQSATVAKFATVQNEGERQGFSCCEFCTNCR